MIKKFFLWGVQRKDARICSVLRPNASWNACRPPQVSVRNSTTIPVVFTGVSGASQALLVAATPRDLVGSNARPNPKLLELLRWLVPNTTLVDSLVNRASSEAAARETGISRAREEGVERETTYVKLNIGAPMSQGVVEVKRIREYIRAHGGYQVDPVASPNWVLMPDGSTRSARRQEVAIYTFLVPQNERKKIADHVKQEGYRVLDVLPDE